MNKKYDVHPEKINYIGHPIELLFSITFHKTQSKTLKKLILCINKCQSRKILPISINSLIVGTSRVQNGNNLRVLAYNDYDLNYLTKLKHNVFLKKWDDNYDKNGIWQPEKLNKVKKSALNSALLELSFVKNLNDLTVDQLYYYLTQLDIYFDKSVDKKKNLIEKLSEKYKDAKEMFSEEKNIDKVVEFRNKIKESLKNIEFDKTKTTILRNYCIAFGLNVNNHTRRNTLIKLLSDMREK